MLRKFLDRFANGLRELWRDLSSPQKFVVGAVFLGLVAAAGLAGLWSARPDMEVLYSGLAPQDGAEVVARLKEEGVEYRLAGGGSAVFVPRSRLDAIRMEMASAGLPRSGSPGFELFDKSLFGMSDFAQKVNYRRALEGELARSIATLREVSAARVVLTVPEQPLFSKEKRAAKASVVVSVGNGTELAAGQVNAIRHLVASAVPELEPSAVAILDDRGRLLSKLRSGAQEGELLDEERFDARQLLEEHLARKVQSLLDAVLGPGKSHVRISADISYKKVERTEQRIDPDSRVVMDETVTTEEVKGTTGAPRGVPGVSANTQPAQGGTPGSAAGLGTQRKQETITSRYEYTTTTEKVVPDPSVIDRLSVAVFIAQRVEGEGSEARAVPRDASQIAALTEGIKSAIGYVGDQTRQDVVTVHEVPFALPRAEGNTPVPAGTDWVVTATRFAKPVGLAVFAIIALLVVRGIVGRSPGGAREGRPDGGTATETGSAGELPQGLRSELDGLVTSNTEQAAEAVRTLLR